MDRKKNSSSNKDTGDMGSSGIQALPGYETLATKIRAHSLRMTHRAGSSHIASSLSIADLLAVLYKGILRIDPTQPQSPNRDRFILSKGHGCAAAYAILAERGFFPREWLDSYYLDGSHLAGHITHHGVPGVEASTGSLGHGLSIGCGMALAGKRDKQTYRVFVLLSDGECDEGSTWEAALFANHRCLDNLIAIVDCNRFQAMGRTEEIINLEPLADKWRAFGWSVREIDGHDCGQIEDAFLGIPFETGKPSCVVAGTVKGKGVSFMENQVAWHYRPPNDDELYRALAELGGLA
jgi:transketolase